MNLSEVVEEIKAAPVKFNQLMEQERYCEAKWLFYDCVETSVFLELDNTIMEQLFGKQGAFAPELVKKAYEKAGEGIDRATKSHAKAQGAGGDV